MKHDDQTQQILEDWRFQHHLFFYTIYTKRLYGDERDSFYVILPTAPRLNHFVDDDTED